MRINRIFFVALITFSFSCFANEVIYIFGSGPAMEKIFLQADKDAEEPGRIENGYAIGAFSLIIGTSASEPTVIPTEVGGFNGAMKVEPSEHPDRYVLLASSGFSFAFASPIGVSDPVQPSFQLQQFSLSKALDFDTSLRAAFVAVSMLGMDSFRFNKILAPINGLEVYSNIQGILGFRMLPTASGIKIPFRFSSYDDISAFHKQSLQLCSVQVNPHTIGEIHWDIEAGSRLKIRSDGAGSPIQKFKFLDENNLPQTIEWASPQTNVSNGVMKTFEPTTDRCFCNSLTYSGPFTENCYFCPCD